MSWMGDNLLVPGETVLYRSKPKMSPVVMQMFLNWRFYIPIVGQIGALMAILRVRSQEYVITSRRIISGEKKAFGRYQWEEINLVAIESVLVRQGFFGEGQVTVKSMSGNNDLYLGRVPNPMQFRSIALARIDEMQS